STTLRVVPLPRERGRICPLHRLRRSPSPVNGGGSVPHLQRLDEGGLGDFHLAELAHALLAFLLLLEQLALARDVAAVALGGDVLPERRDRLAGNDAAADRGLDRDLEHVLRDELLE